MSNHNFQFHFRYIQDFINMKMDQAKRKMSRKVSDKSLDPKKCWSLLKTLSNGKKYLVCHLHIIIANCYLKLRHRVSSLIEIFQKIEHFLSIIAGCQQDLQLIPSLF